MSDVPSPPPAVVEGPVSIARLHAEACFYCGAVTRTLYAAGHITLEGQDRVWPIVTCGCHSKAVAS
jgi:hypothetical protein